MSASVPSHSHLESPAPGATLPQGRHWLRGWVWPEAGGVFVDVRARVGPRLFPGIHGLPRPDLAAHFQTGRPVALAEFAVAVDLAPGAADVVLEVLEIEGRWRPFRTVTYVVAPADPPAHFAVPAGPLRWIDHGFGLRRLLQQAARQPRVPLERLARELAEALPWPRVLRDPPAPLLGFVDEPASVCCCRFGRIPAFGHLFHPQLRTRRILATVDLQAWQPLEIHRPSPGPAAFYPQFPHAQACGFHGLVDVPVQLPNPLSLRLYAELEDGSLHLGPVVRTRVHTQDDEKPADMAGAPADFDAALAAWEHALQERRIPVARGAELDRYLAQLRHEHRAARPGSPPAPAPELRIRTDAATPARVLLATHGLSLQGAPRFLLELARALASAGSALSVLSAEDGPLRAEFEAIGATVGIADCAAILAAESDDSARAAVAALAGRPEWRAADLVIANSFTTFWAVHAAKAQGRPVLFYVHESTTPALFYDRRVPPRVVALAEEAFVLADAVSFTTDATRRCHLGSGRTAHYCVTPGWVDLARLDAWRACQDREELRRALGVQPGGQLVCNIGTISDRKGQHTFARAVDLFNRRYPDLARRTRFLLLGGGDTPFDAMLAGALAGLACDNLVVHRETRDYLRYYLAADLFACSSYEESSPRVVFEAMALGVPLLASAVQGVPELARDGLEAVLLPPGDTVAWSDALARALSAPPTARELAARARARAEYLFSAPAVLPGHLRLAATVAAGR